MTTTLTLGQVAIDCTDAVRLATFWSRFLDLPVQPDANAFVAIVSGSAERGLPSLLFLQVPEPATAKNRWHLDLISADHEAEVDRAVSLGAEHRGDFEEWGTAWTTLADPEGNLFDIGRPHT